MFYHCLQKPSKILHHCTLPENEQLQYSELLTLLNIPEFKSQSGNPDCCSETVTVVTKKIKDQGISPSTSDTTMLIWLIK